jgi:hypothetical protein
MTCLNLLSHHSPGKTVGNLKNSPVTLAESLCQESNLVLVEYKPRILYICMYKGWAIKLALAPRPLMPRMLLTH